MSNEASQTTYERIRLQGEHFVIQHTESHNLMDLQDDVRRSILDDMVHTLRAKVWAHRETHALPADWWEAVKLRWFPQWALRRWPVRMLNLTLLAKYPTLRVANETHKSYLDVVQIVNPCPATFAKP